MTDQPLPDVRDSRFASYWDGTRAGELRVQRCDDCLALRWPPREVCDACYSFAYSWRPVAAWGTLHSWTVVGHQTVPGIELPYVVGLVDLGAAPGIRQLGRVLDVPDGTDLAVGAPMEAVFVRVNDDVTLVHWRPRRGPQG